MSDRPRPGRPRPWWAPAALAGACLLAWALQVEGRRHHDAPDHQEPSWLTVSPEIWAIARARRQAAAEQPPKPTAVAVALLRGNTLGDRILGGWTLVRIEGPDEQGRFAFAVRRGDGEPLTIRVTPVDTEPHRPPLRTDTFDYFYDSIAPGVGLDDRGAVELLRDLSRFIEAEP